MNDRDKSIKSEAISESRSQKSHDSFRKICGPFLRAIRITGDFVHLLFIFFHIVSNTIIFPQNCLTPFVTLAIEKCLPSEKKKERKPVTWMKLLYTGSYLICGYYDVVHRLLYVWLLKGKAHCTTDRMWTLESNGCGFKSKLFHLSGMLLEYVNGYL